MLDKAVKFSVTNDCDKIAQLHFSKIKGQISNIPDVLVENISTFLGLIIDSSFK